MESRRSFFHTYSIASGKRKVRYRGSREVSGWDLPSRDIWLSCTAERFAQRATGSLEARFSKSIFRSRRNAEIRHVPKSAEGKLTAAGLMSGLSDSTACMYW